VAQLQELVLARLVSGGDTSVDRRAIPCSCVVGVLHPKGRSNSERSGPRRKRWWFRATRNDMDDERQTIVSAVARSLHSKLSKTTHPDHHATRHPATVAEVYQLQVRRCAAAMSHLETEGHVGALSPKGPRASSGPCIRLNTFVVVRRKTGRLHRSNPTVLGDRPETMSGLGIWPYLGLR
jgi:hypothetical protein